MLEDIVEFWGRYCPHRASRYDGSVGRSTRASFSREEGASLLRADCNHISVYSSPNVCFAARHYYNQVHGRQGV